MSFTLIVQIRKDSVDLPITGNFDPEELHSYPPKMVCRYFPERGAVSTTSTLALHGFDRPVSTDMALLVPEPAAVDTTELQVCTTDHCV